VAVIAISRFLAITSHRTHLVVKVTSNRFTSMAQYASSPAWASHGQAMITAYQNRPNPNALPSGPWAYRSTPVNLAAGSGTYAIRVPVPADLSISVPAGGTVGGPLEISIPPDLGAVPQIGSTQMGHGSSGSYIQVSLTVNLPKTYSGFTLWIGNG
jgi:hypothetical protein